RLLPFEAELLGIGLLCLSLPFIEVVNICNCLCLLVFLGSSWFLSDCVSRGFRRRVTGRAAEDLLAERLEIPCRNALPQPFAFLSSLCFFNCAGTLLATATPAKSEYALLCRSRCRRRRRGMRWKLSSSRCSIA